MFQIVRIFQSDHISGACQCSAGWQGALCDGPCPPGSHGYNCTKSCQAGSHIIVLHQFYVLSLPSTHSGKWGKQLGFRSSPHFPLINELSRFFNITMRGNLNDSRLQCQHGGKCHPVTGACSCTAGWEVRHPSVDTKCFRDFYFPALNYGLALDQHNPGICFQHYAANLRYIEMHNISYLHVIKYFLYERHYFLSMCGPSE